MNYKEKCLRNNTVSTQTTQSTLTRKKSDRRYLLGIGIFAFAFTGIVGLSFGGFSTEVSARENTFSLRTTLQDLLNGGGQRNTQQPRQPQQNEQTRQQVQPQAPVTPQVTETVAPVQGPVTTQQQPQQTTQIVQPVQQSAPVEVTPVDTAPQIALTTSAQAQVASQPVTYTSKQISTDTRDQLLIAATIGLVAGILLLLLSITIPKSATLARAKAVRIKIPVREASTQ